MEKEDPHKKTKGKRTTWKEHGDGSREKRRERAETQRSKFFKAQKALRGTPESDGTVSVEVPKMNPKYFRDEMFHFYFNQLKNQGSIDDLRVTATACLLAQKIVFNEIQTDAELNAYISSILFQQELNTMMAHISNPKNLHLKIEVLGLRSIGLIQSKK